MCFHNNFATLLVFFSPTGTLKKEEHFALDEQPCDLRLLTPKTYLKEMETAASTTHTATTALAGSIPPAMFKGIGSGITVSTTASLTSSVPTSPVSQQPSPVASFIGQIPTVPSTMGGAYSCSRCGNSYARPHSLNRHVRFECGVEPKFECPICHKKSKHKHNLVLHMRTHQHR
jgi:hypothetical protein